jgi:hypothetical protein
VLADFLEEEGPPGDHGRLLRRIAEGDVDGTASFWAYNIFNLYVDLGAETVCVEYVLPEMGTDTVIPLPEFVARLT